MENMTDFDARKMRENRFEFGFEFVFEFGFETQSHSNLEDKTRGVIDPLDSDIQIFSHSVTRNLRQ